MVERRPGLTLFSHLVLLLGIAVVAFPIYLAFVASTHTRDAIVQVPMPLLPGGHLLDNYGAALFGAKTQGAHVVVGRMMWISFVTAMVIAVGKIAISLLSA
ncbi:MAG TPA: glycerol-3-phosphate transporter, partial [Burkholderiaceae bacterium]|nr:glycerol-3-phosphate transporter [Burkholderiaceae bacterium]